LEPGGTSRRLGVPAPAGNLDEESGAIVCSGPRRHSCRRTDDDPDGGGLIFMVDECESTGAEHRQHAAVGDENVSMQIVNAGGSRLLDQGIEKVWTQPSSSVLGDGDAKLGVTIG